MCDAGYPIVLFSPPIKCVKCMASQNVKTLSCYQVSRCGHWGLNRFKLEVQHEANPVLFRTVEIKKNVKHKSQAVLQMPARILTLCCDRNIKAYKSYTLLFYLYIYINTFDYDINVTFYAYYNIYIYIHTQKGSVSKWAGSGFFGWCRSGNPREREEQQALGSVVVAIAAVLLA